MSGFLQQLPTIVVTAVLLVMFAALRPPDDAHRARISFSAWVLVLLHLLIQTFAVDGAPVAQAFDDSIRVVAGVLFTISLLRIAATPARSLVLLVTTSIPIVGYATAAAFRVTFAGWYALCTIAIFAGSFAACVFLDRRFLRQGVVYGVLGVVACVWTLARIWRGDFSFGNMAVLTIAFALPGFLFWRLYRRPSPGVLAVVFGFLTWAATFPLRGVFVRLAPVGMNPQFWDLPKFFVAFGMIMTSIEDASAREVEAKRQLERFSEINTHLLSGAPPAKICDAICAAIVETSIFARCNIALQSSDVLVLAGSAGFSGDSLAALRERVTHWTREQITALTRIGTPLGSNSFTFDPESITEFSPVPSSRDYEPGSNWRRGSKLVIPLPSRRIGYLGVITLDEPRDPHRVSAEEVSRIELVASDLAIALENEELQRHLVSSEKMAAMGQLVGGVAHELNNPLTAVIGYADLLNDETEGETQQRVQKLAREAQRMKRIITNLLLFARHEAPRREDSDVEQVLREVVALREYNLKSLGVNIETALDPGLPRVAADENHMRQIMLNVLNNAIEAVTSADRRNIRVTASQRGSSVVIRVEDTGRGFADVARAVDPFYTTKPLGKGPGLGLSICYGIVRELGGTLHLQNTSEGGAAVTIDIPSAIAMSHGA